MKRKLSILNLIASHSMRWVLLILGALVIGDAAIFAIYLNGTKAELSVLLDDNRLLLLFAGAFALLTLVLCLAMCDRGGRQNYLLNRLRVSPKMLYMTHAFYNGACYFLLFAVQALTLLGICLWSERAYASYFNHQTLFLTCYQSDFLHAFFPLENVMGWISNIFLILGLGICTAALPVRNRSRNLSISTFLMAGHGLAFFLLLCESSMDPTVYFLGIFNSVVYLLVSLFGVLSLEVDADV